MAITYITGIPRSGKSYYAMYLLYKQFVEQKKTLSKFDKLLSNLIPTKTISKSWDIAYTNINQFDFSKTDKIKLFDYDEIIPHIEVLQLMYLDKKSDDILIEYAKEHNLYNCLFVIDEAQNFFSKVDPVVTWWFTYHGHLHHDIILITQNLDLIEKSYFKLAEFYYKAVPPSSRFFSNKFRYIQFNSYKLFKIDRIGDFHVPMIPEIFAMYVSGASNDAKSVVKRYFLYFIILCLVVVGLFFNFLSMFQTQISNDSNATKKENNITIPSSNELKPLKEKITSTEKIIPDSSAYELFDIRCVDMLCNYKGTDFPLPLFNKLTAKFPPEFSWFFKNATYTQYFVMLPPDTFDFLQIDDKKDKDADSKTQKAPSAINTIASKQSSR